jgi:hypothetical protein
MSATGRICVPNLGQRVDDAVEWVVRAARDHSQRAAAQHGTGKQLAQHRRLAQAIEQLSRELPDGQHDGQDEEQAHQLLRPCGCRRGHREAGEHHSGARATGFKRRV